MTKKNDGRPAFPQPIDDMGTFTAVTQGMSLRQYYAGKAMQGYLSGLLANERTFVSDLKKEQISKISFVIADAMIAYEEGEK